MSDLLGLIEVGGVFALIVGAAVAAIRARLPVIDGWRVLLLAAGCAVAMCALFLPVASAADLLHAGRVAVLAWLISVGGTQWVSALVAKIGTTKKVG